MLKKKSIIIVTYLMVGSLLSAAERTPAVGLPHDSVLTTNFWSPVGVSMVLDTPAVSHVLRGLGTPGATWSYDPAKFRLFRWINNGWLEYGDSRSDTFAFVPGRVMWLKVSQAIEDNIQDLDLGGGAALISPDTILIPPRGWADFCNPCRFNIRFSQVLAATAGGSVGDSLCLYQWTGGYDTLTGSESYMNTPIYLPGYPTLGNADTIIAGSVNGFQAAGAYSLYNGSGNPVSVIVPPTPADTTPAVTAGAKERATGGWAVGVTARTASGTRLNPVYCGYAPGSGGSRYFPASSHWGGVSVGVVDQSTNTTFGHALARTIDGGGLLFDLVFANSQDRAETVTFSAAPLSGSSVAPMVSIIDPVTGTVQAAAVSQKFSISVPGNGRVFWLLAAGSADFAAGAARSLPRGAFGFLQVRPNPVHGAVAVDYFVPWNLVADVRCEVLDLNGRIIRTRSAGKSLHPGTNTFRWNASGAGRLSPGTYIVRLTGLDGSGVPLVQKLSRLTSLP